MKKIKNARINTEIDLCAIFRRRKIGLRAILQILRRGSMRPAGMESTVLAELAAAKGVEDVGLDAP